jgi:biotin carboxylase
LDTDTDGVVLVIGSGMQRYRQYLLEAASQRNPLWLIDEHETGWQRPLIAGSSVVPPLDEVREIPDQQGMIDAAVAVAQTRRVVGAFTYDELLVIPTASIAHQIGLRGLSPQGAANCRDKHETRRALTAAGLPQPRSILARTLEEAQRAAEDIGYPVIMKPLGMGASVGVVEADTPEELSAAYRIAERASRFGPLAYEGGVLVEERIAGEEISIDGAIVDGEHRGYLLARKQTSQPPYFEELGHVVDATDPLLADAELRDVLVRAHRALGVRDGITHTEVRLSERGLVIIEVNGRLAGDLVPYVGRLANGIDSGHVAVDVAMGVAPSLEPSRRGCAAIRFFYPPEDCRVEEISLPGQDAVPGLAAAHAMARPGDVLRLPPRSHVARYAYAICTADDPGTCLDRMAEAAKLTTLRYEALDPSTSDNERPW